MRRFVRPLTDAQLRVLTPSRADAYRRRRLSLESSASDSDLGPVEVADLDADLIYFEDDPRWPALMAAVLAVARER